MATKIALLASLLFAAACANDTGNPRQPPSPPAAVPDRRTVPPSGGSPALPVTGTRPPPVVDSAMCSIVARDNAHGLVGEDCIDCTCQTNPAATLACSVGCWTLFACVTSHCDRSDINCILRECSDDLGGLSNLASVATQTSATPFFECGAKCALPRPAIRDSGASVDNDF